MSKGFSQQTNASAGTDATGSTGSASITIGQQDYSNYSGSTGYSNEGVQHPKELFGIDYLYARRVDVNNFFDFRKASYVKIEKPVL